MSARISDDRLSNLKAQAKKIAERIEAARARQRALRAERETLILPARVEQNESALAHLRAIDGELTVIESELSSDAEATAQLDKQMEKRAH